MKSVLVALSLLAAPAIVLAQDEAPAAIDEFAAAAFAAMDSDRDGQLSLREFEKGVARPFGAHAQGVVYQRLPARFRSFDGDQDGFLEAPEYAAFAQSWHGEGAAPALEEADRNGDGKLDFREFAALHVDPGETDEPSAAEAASEATLGSRGRMHSPRAPAKATIRRTG